MTSRSKRKLIWLSVYAGAATAAAVVVGVRAYRRKFAAEAARLAEVLNLRPGMTVAEVGAGKGEMTIRLAQRVRPDGRAIATEFEPKRLRTIRRALQKRGIGNVALLEGTQTGSELPPNCCDAIFMRVAYHHFTAPDVMDRSLFRALRPGGTLAVIDFPPRLLLSFWTPKGIPQNRGGHGIQQELLKQELKQVGFQPVGEHNDWPFRLYCVVFRKPAA